VSNEDWSLEFSKYQESPEFKRVNFKMTVEEFKYIYWMEYAHRMWGRALGVVFVVPAAWFSIRGYLSSERASRLALLFAMGGTQVSSLACLRAQTLCTCTCSHYAIRNLASSLGK
jgi:heme a synthase